MSRMFTVYAISADLLHKHGLSYQRGSGLSTMHEQRRTSRDEAG
jgi:hypothetical protein